MSNAQLSLEQQFNLKAFKSQVQQMSREQAQASLVELYTMMVKREAAYKELLRKTWGLD